MSGNFSKLDENYKPTDPRTRDMGKKKHTKAWHKKNLFKTNDKDKNLKSNKEEDSLSTEE